MKQKISPVKEITLKLSLKSATYIFHRILRKENEAWRELLKALQENGGYCMHCEASKKKSIEKKAEIKPLEILPPVQMFKDENTNLISFCDIATPRVIFDSIRDLQKAVNNLTKQSK